MPSKNLMRFLKPDAKLSSNGFDLSHREVFSMKAGALNVAMYLPCVQGDYHEIRPTSYISTMPFNVANFTRMKQHMDFFFVPFTCIQSRWFEWYQQTTDPSNAWFATTSTDEDDFIPHLNLAELVCALCYASCIDHASDLSDAISNYGIQTEATLQCIGTRFLNNIQGIGSPNNLFRLFVDDNNALRVDKLGYPVYLNAVRLLDMCGYGNFLPCVKLPIFTGNFIVIDGSTQTSHDFEDHITGMAQDFDLQFLPSIDVDINLQVLAAYQAVCQNYFINTYYERPDVQSYNFDDMTQTGDLYQRNGDFDSNGVLQLFTQNYRTWKKDIYLSALPSPQFGDVSVVTILSDKLVRTDSDAAVLAGQLLSKTTGQFGNSSTTYGLSGDFSVIDLRKAEALQYWREQVGRAGFRYTDRFRATFGDVPGFDPRVNPVPVGSFVADVSKDPVTGTSGDDFGDKRATGSSLLQNEVIKFKAPSFGILIGLMSILPESDYDSFMIDKQHTKFVPFDFFTPALQNLGLVPINVRQLSVYTDDMYSGNSLVLGYVPSYYEHKTAIDKIHGEFSTMPSMFMRDIQTSPIGQFCSFASSRIDMESFTGTVRQYYVDPAVLDHIFLQDADAEQSSDQFHVSCYFDIKSYRPMSVLGLPQF